MSKNQGVYIALKSAAKNSYVFQDVFPVRGRNLPCSKFVENEEVTLRVQFVYFLLTVTDKIKGRPSSTPPQLAFKSSFYPAKSFFILDIFDQLVIFY